VRGEEEDGLVVLLRVLIKEVAARMGRLKTKEGKKPTAIPFLPSAAMPYENCCQLSSVALYIPMSI
jgi:hypothetical protein